VRSSATPASVVGAPYRGPPPAVVVIEGQGMQGGERESKTCCAFRCFFTCPIALYRPIPIGATTCPVFFPVSAHAVMHHIAMTIARSSPAFPSPISPVNELFLVESIDIDHAFDQVSCRSDLPATTTSSSVVDFAFAVAWKLHAVERKA
jgi:hypothetical protein